MQFFDKRTQKIMIKFHIIVISFSYPKSVSPRKPYKKDNRRKIFIENQKIHVE